MQRQTPNRRRKSEQGYILVTLTLFVALLAVAALAIAPSVTFQIRRDREEEMIHRGVQYSRAIQKYFKKFGRYPTSLKDLENTNNIRFLRKPYKDPITGKDFRLLHYGEVQMISMGAGIPGTTPAAMAASGMPGASGNAPQGLSFGASGTQTTTGLGQPTGQGNSQADSTSNTNSPAEQNESGSSAASPQIIGGPIVGVISTSKAKSIREFGGKSHYNQWQFIYDPGMLQGNGLIKTPAQPMSQAMMANMNGAGQPGTQAPGSPASGFGSNSNQFGSSPNAFGSQPQPAQTPSQSSAPLPLPQPQPPDQ